MMIQISPATTIGCKTQLCELSPRIAAITLIALALLFGGGAIALGSSSFCHINALASLGTGGALSLVVGGSLLLLALASVATYQLIHSAQTKKDLPSSFPSSNVNSRPTIEPPPKKPLAADQELRSPPPSLIIPPSQNFDDTVRVAKTAEISYLASPAHLEPDLELEEVVTLHSPLVRGASLKKEISFAPVSQTEEFESNSFDKLAKKYPFLEKNRSLNEQIAPKQFLFLTVNESHPPRFYCLYQNSKKARLACTSTQEKLLRDTVNECLVSSGKGYQELMLDQGPAQ